MNCRFVIGCLFIFVLIFQCSIARNKDDIESKIERFSTNFYKNVAKNTDGNFISSPFITLITLMMTALGSAGNTYREVVDALNLEFRRKRIVHYFYDIITNLNDATNVELHVANKLFLDETFEIRPFYEFNIVPIFGAEIERINLQNSNDAANIINHWCDIKTKGKISNIVKSDDLQNAQMVLINAIYFKANWKNAFNENLENQLFHLSKRKSVSIPMMCRQDYYNFGDIRDVPAIYIELPYKTNDPHKQFSMYVVVPKLINGLHDISNRIHSIIFSKLKSGDEEVRICMPQFRIESTLDLIPILQKMGIRQMFENNADFSPLSLNNDLKVDKIIQKVYINVDRKGTEAAAVSGSLFGPRIFVSSFIVDKPFMAIIVDKSSGMPLFWGQVNDPRPNSTQ